MADGTKITIGITKKLLGEVDEYAKTLNINRTSAISVLLSQALAQNKAMNAMTDIIPMLGRLEQMATSGSRIGVQKEIE